MQQPASYRPRCAKGRALKNLKVSELHSCHNLRSASFDMKAARRLISIDVVASVHAYVQPHSLPRFRVYAKQSG